MNYIEATITVLDAHVENVKALFVSTDMKIVKQDTNKEQSIAILHIGGIGCRSDLRLGIILDHLREQGISYSYVWYEPNCDLGGESHYRSNGKDEQHLSWMDYEKNLVNIEDVRQAVTQGELAVLELLDITENNFSPWNWNTIAP